MSNLNGWNLTGRLITKHFGALGDKIASAIAAFDPETATEADRDNLQGMLRETAVKMATARQGFDKEHNDVVELTALIANDEKVSEVLIERLTAGTISEAAVTAFCDELEANKKRLPTEQQEEIDAKAFMDELQQIVTALSQQLADFDTAAKKARTTLATAQAQKDLQTLRTTRQEELQHLQGMGGSSSALAALTKRAAQVSAEAAGMKIVADINQAPIDQKNEVDEIRRSVASDATTTETTVERLRRLTAKPEAAAAATA